MKCKYCGFALSLNQATCPHCGMLMSEDQLKRKKQLNGHNNAYMDRLNKLNEQKIKYKLYENEQPKNIIGSIAIVAVIILIAIIAVVIYMSGD